MFGPYTTAVRADEISSFRIADEVREALRVAQPVVALESAVLTHGLPFPSNVEALRAMDRAVRAEGAVPAVCLIDHGRLWVGASEVQAESAALDADRQKASVRDLGAAISSGKPAGLTVSATLFAAHRAGIRVFSTGGIGGVHRGDSDDVSTDLVELSRRPVITVCSGAKSVLDIPRTLELLETLGVPVFAFQTDLFPAFYLETSGCRVPGLTSASAVADSACVQWDLGYEAAVLLANPIPKQAAIRHEDWTAWLDAAEREARHGQVRGKEVTPFLLTKVAELSCGRTVSANLALLEANARLAGEIAAALAS